MASDETSNPGTQSVDAPEPPPSNEKNHQVKAQEVDIPQAPPTGAAPDHPRQSSADMMPSRLGSRMFVPRDLAEMAAAVVALLALLLSVFNWREANKESEMIVTMPLYLRLTHHTDGYTVSMQPIFTLRRTSNLTTVVSTVRLEVNPSADFSPRFRWLDVIRYVNNKKTLIPEWEYVADPAPMIVTQDLPSNDYLRFISDDPLRAGTWSMHMIVERPEQQPLRKSFCVTITGSDVKELEENLGGYRTFRNNFDDDQPERAGAADCYRLKA